LSTSNLLMVIPWLLLLMTWYSLWGLKGKIKCQFRRKDGTTETKTLPMKGGYVYYNGGRYEINRRRIDIHWAKLWGLLPFPMPFLEWKWDTDQPLDPKTFKNSWDSPEARNASDSEKDWRSFNQGWDSQTGSKKSSGFERWIPWIALGAIVIVGFLVYQLSGKLGVIEQQIQSLGGMIKSMK
jgi:hypothetical protein